MPSPEIQRVKAYWDARARAAKPASIAELRLLDDHWAALTSEPEDVDYVRVDYAGVKCLWAAPKSAGVEPIIVCFHGGGYTTGSSFSHRKLYGHLAKLVGVRALLVDYRLAPENPFPAQVNDAFSVYRCLLSLGARPYQIALVGDEAGGGLALATALRARDEGAPRPAAIMAMSAWTDMSLAGASYETNKRKDLAFGRAAVGERVSAFLGALSERRTPYASPITADLTGLPPVCLQVGGDEAMLDDSVVLAERARAAGVDVDITVFAGLAHGFQMAAGRAREADEALMLLAKWLRPRLGIGVLT